MPKIALGLGSNIQPKEKYILAAIHALQQHFSPLGISNCYRTTAYDQQKQEDYYNLVVSFTSEKPAVEILAKTQAIEQQLGRNIVREKKQPRTIDIDILFYGNQKIQITNLQIPHYDLHNRDFFLIPLLELVDEKFPADFQKKKIQKTLQKIAPHKKTNPILLPTFTSIKKYKDS